MTAAWIGLACLICLLPLDPAWAQAAQDPTSATTQPAANPVLPDITVARVGTQDVSLSLQVLLVMTFITLLPAVLLSMTAFTRIIIVLALLRQALGTGQTPSNQILLGLALFLTLLVMMPTLDVAWEAGIRPYLDGQLDARAAFDAAIAPFRAFMFAQVRERDLLMFAGLAGSTGYAGPEDVPLHILAASFLTSELRTAFEIGFLLFIPFVVIDLVVASVLMSMGMMMMSPMLVSAPFKILLFVLVDGWILVMGSLAASFRMP
nr:flagellar type III secretion system pore protein FliP [Pseudomarimonas arenosa]